jgi:hypothetical protein
MTLAHEQTLSRHLESIKTKYGELLTTEEIAAVFKYRSAAAVRKAHSRKSLPVRLYKFVGRSGYYAKAEDVANCLDRMEVVPTEQDAFGSIHNEE